MIRTGWLLLIILASFWLIGAQPYANAHVSERSDRATSLNTVSSKKIEHKRISIPSTVQGSSKIIISGLFIDKYGTLLANSPSLEDLPNKKQK